MAKFWMASWVSMAMHLDTLYADLDAGKLYLTWRGHAPIREIDMTDVAVVLIASEPLHAEPKPFADYEAQLLDYEKDPVGLAAAMPPGFLAVANAIQAADGHIYPIDPVIERITPDFGQFLRQEPYTINLR